MTKEHRETKPSQKKKDKPPKIVKETVKDLESKDAQDVKGGAIKTYECSL